MVIEIYKVPRGCSKSEPYGLAAQVRRAAVSAPVNIAEGSARQYAKEHLQFLHMAESSLSEVTYYIHLAHRLKLIDKEGKSRLETMHFDACRPFRGLMADVEQQRAKGVLLNKRVSERGEPYAAG